MKLSEALALHLGHMRHLLVRRDQTRIANGLDAGMALLKAQCPHIARERLTRDLARCTELGGHAKQDLDLRLEVVLDAVSNLIDGELELRLQLSGQRLAALLPGRQADRKPKRQHQRGQQKPP